MRFVDVLESAYLETLRESVVFFLRNVVVSLVDELESPVETAAPIETRVNGSMIVQVLAIVDGGLLDFVDGFIDVVNGFLFLITEFAAIGALEMGARVTEIGQGVKIRWMVSRRLRLCKDDRRNKEQ